MTRNEARPIGKTAQAGAARRRGASARYRVAEGKLARAHQIAKLLIHLRTERGLTQEAVARRAGTSYSQISRIESGRHDVSARTLDRIFRSLDVTPLFGYEIPAREGRPARREFVAF